MQFRLPAFVAVLLIVGFSTSEADAQIWGDKPRDGGRMAVLVPSFQLGGVVDGGRGIYTVPGTDYTPMLTGYTYSERTGLISGLIWGGWAQLAGVASAAGAMAPQNTETTTTRETSYSPDGRTKTVKETTTTTGTITAEQGEEAQRALDAGKAASEDAILALGNGLDVTIYDDDIAGSDLGDGWGYMVKFWMPLVVGDHAQFELGWQLGDVVSVDPDAQEAIRSYSWAFPLRMIVGFSYFYASLRWDMNFASFFNHDDRMEEVDGVNMLLRETRPWPLTLDVHATWWRLHLYGAVMTSRPLDFDFGYRFGAGIRF